MQSLLFFLLAALAGLFQPIQSGINSQLKYDLNSTYLSGGCKLIPETTFKRAYGRLQI